jgi:hypothetical protein
MRNVPPLAGDLRPFARFRRPRLATCFCPGMNAPLPPPVNIENLANLAPLESMRARRRVGTAVAASLVSALGVLLWRLAPIPRLRRLRSSRRSVWIGAGVGLAAFVVGRQLQRLFTVKPKYAVESAQVRVPFRPSPASPPGQLEGETGQA